MNAVRPCRRRDHRRSGWGCHEPITCAADAHRMRVARVTVTTDDRRRFAKTYDDLGEAAVMDRAWQ